MRTFILGILAAVLFVGAFGSRCAAQTAMRDHGALVVQPLPAGQLSTDDCSVTVLGTPHYAPCVQWRALAVDSLIAQRYVLKFDWKFNEMYADVRVRPDTLTHVIADVPSDSVRFSYIHRDSVRKWLERHYRTPSADHMDRLPFEHGPVVIAQGPPQYPEEALRRKQEGAVLVELSVDAHGTVTSAQVVDGIPGLDEAAVACARHWRFRPARLFGHTVPSRGVWRVRFSPRGQ
jgi:TonB family protein